LYETDASGTVVQSYVYGENGQLLAMKKAMRHTFTTITPMAMSSL